MNAGTEYPTREKSIAARDGHYALFVCVVYYRLSAASSDGMNFAMYCF